MKDSEEIPFVLVGNKVIYQQNQLTDNIQWKAKIRSDTNYSAVWSWNIKGGAQGEGRRVGNKAEMQVPGEQCKGEGERDWELLRASAGDQGLQEITCAQGVPGYGYQEIQVQVQFVVDHPAYLPISNSIFTPSFWIGRTSIVVLFFWRSPWWVLKILDQS